MRALLDTHALLWWLEGDERLSRPAREFIGNEDNAIWVSAVSAWEIATKVRLGKLPGAVEVAAQFATCLRQQASPRLPSPSITLCGREPCPGLIAIRSTGC